MYRVVARFVPHDPPRMVRVPNVIVQVNELPSAGCARNRLPLGIEAGEKSSARAH